MDITKLSDDELRSLAGGKSTTPSGDITKLSDDELRSLVGSGAQQPDSIAKNLDQGMNPVKAVWTQVAQHPFKTALQGPVETGSGKTAMETQTEQVMQPDFMQSKTKPFDKFLPRARAAAENRIVGGFVADQFSPANVFGGEVLGAAAKGAKVIPDLLGGVSGRIHNLMARLPTKAFNYAKDPLSVLAKEKLQANTITDYAEKASQRLSQRTAELNDAIKNSDKTVDVSGIIDQHMKDATEAAQGSLQDRTAVLNKIKYMKDALSKKYGDLSNLSVQKSVKLYRQLADDFPFSGDPEGNIMAKTAHKMYHDIGAAVDAAHPEIADLNQRVSGLIDITKAAENRAAIEARNNPIGLVGSILGITGGYTGGRLTGHNQAESIGMGLALPIGLKIASSPAVLTRVANALSKMSDVGKMDVLKAFPFLKEKLPAETFKAKSPLGLPAPEAPLPKYLQERQNIPPIEAGEKPFMQNPILMGGEKYQAPLGLPAPKTVTPEAPMPQYLKDRQNIPQEPIPLGRPDVPYTPGPQAIIHKPPAPGETLNNPITDFNPIKKGSGLAKKSVPYIGAALAATMISNPVSAKSSNDIDMNKIYQIESSGNKNVVNNKSGAKGLGQITPIVLKEWNNLNKKQYSDKDLTDAATNMKISDWYMNKRIPQLLKSKKLPDNVKNRLVAYNAGISHVGKSILPKKTYDYIQKYNKE